MVERRKIDTQIPVSKETRKQLRSCGDKGQTYDQVIQELIEEVKQS